MAVWLAVCGFLCGCVAVLLCMCGCVCVWLCVCVCVCVCVDRHSFDQRLHVWRRVPLARGSSDAATGDGDAGNGSFVLPLVFPGDEVSIAQVAERRMRLQAATRTAIEAWYESSDSDGSVSTDSDGRSQHRRRRRERRRVRVLPPPAVGTFVCSRNKQWQRGVPETPMKPKFWVARVMALGPGSGPDARPDVVKVVKVRCRACRGCVLGPLQLAGGTSTSIRPHMHTHPALRASCRCHCDALYS